MTLRFAANLTWLYTEMGMLERFGAARSAGFDGVEILFPYDLPVPDVMDRLGMNGLEMVLINCPPPNYTERPKGFAAIPGGEAHFRQDFRRALRVAASLRARHLHVMAGVAEGVAARDVLVENLAWAAAEAPAQSITIEPINAGDMPGYFLNSFDLALEVLERVDAPNVGLQFDTYQAHQIRGDVLTTWDATASRVSHIQISGVPGRNEPMDAAAFLARVVADGYDGWVGAEYDPAGRTDEGIGWLKEFSAPV